jgi:cell division transport system permease protein
MTVATIGLALALPAALFVVLDNLERWGSGWSGQLGMSVFMRQDVGAEESSILASELRGRPGIAAVEVVEPDAAMAEFRAQTDFGAALDALTDNPLPFVLAISANDSSDASASLTTLAEELEQHPAVDMTRLDTAWVQRLQAILALLRRGVLVIGGLLGLTVLLVVGNTVRLEIENRRDEILISKLVGATDAFVRRPFVLEGLLLGLAGGLIAWVAVQLTLLAVAAPAAQLGSLYGSDAALVGPGLDGFVDLLSAGGLLGFLGAWFAVAQRLRAIEPE